MNSGCSSGSGKGVTAHRALHQIYAGWWVNIGCSVIPHQTFAGALSTCHIIEPVSDAYRSGDLRLGGGSLSGCLNNMCGVVGAVQTAL